MLCYVVTVAEFTWTSSFLRPRCKGQHVITTSICTLRAIPYVRFPLKRFTMKISHTHHIHTRETCFIYVKDKKASKTNEPYSMAKY